MWSKEGKGGGRIEADHPLLPALSHGAGGREGANWVVAQNSRWGIKSWKTMTGELLRSAAHLHLPSLFYRGINWGPGQVVLVWGRTETSRPWERAQVAKLSGQNSLLSPPRSADLRWTSTSTPQPEVWFRTLALLPTSSVTLGGLLLWASVSFRVDNNSCRTRLLWGLNDIKVEGRHLAD